LQQIRRVYWNLISISLKEDIARNLLKSSKVQLKNIIRRSNASIANRSDIYRGRSLVSQRRSMIENLKMKKENLIRKLVHYIPGIDPKKIRLPNIKYKDFNSNKKVKAYQKKLNECVSLVIRKKDTPYNWSTLTENIRLGSIITKKQVKLATKESLYDLKLNLMYKGEGFEKNSSDSLKELFSFNKYDSSAVLKFQMPLGSDNKNLIKEKAISIKLKKEAQTREVFSLLKSTHLSYQKFAIHFKSSIGDLKNAVYFLRSQLKDLRKQFYQGRLNYLSFIREEDSLHNLEIEFISSQIEFINQVLNYLILFDKAPCSFNLGTKYFPK